MNNLRKIIKKLLSIYYKKNNDFLWENSFGLNNRLGLNTILEKVKIGDNSSIGNYNYIHDSIIGDFSYTARNVSIMKTKIGNFCSIAKNTSIGIGDHPLNLVSTSPFFYSNNSPFTEKLVNEKIFNDLKNVEIGNDVWIGANVVIMNGVKINNGVVIGANAVVTKDIPPYAIVVGVPGKIIKYRFSKETIDEIQNLEWWNWSLKKIRSNRLFFISEKK